MKNKELAQIFNEFADILEYLNIAWKPIAYRKAARSLESLSVDLKDLYREGGMDSLLELPGIGEHIAQKIVEYLKTGKIKEFETLRRKAPKHIEILLRVPGLGPKRVFTLVQSLHIKDLDDLRKAAEGKKIQTLPGFGVKTEQDILRGISFVNTHERLLIGDVRPVALSLVSYLSSLPSFSEIVIGGSLRRWKETIRDIDLLAVSSSPAEAMRAFTSMSDVIAILSQGETKSSVRLQQGMNCDLRIVEKKSFGAALQYFTGNKDHNIALRNIAIDKGLKLNEYGLFKKEKYIAGKTEEDVYAALGLSYIEPELREYQGEIEASSKRKLPKLIPYSSIRGDLQLHSTWSDGLHNIEEMILGCRSLGYEYMALTDHSQREAIAKGMDSARLKKYVQEIISLRKKYSDIHILIGAEVSILPDGKLDYSDTLLKKLDFVLAAVHSGFKMTEAQMTKRIVKALSHPRVSCLAHPTGRLLNEREEYTVDLEQMFDAAREHFVCLEANASPHRLDLQDIHVRRAIQRKVKLMINTDSHSVSELCNMEYGIASARRGWATKKDIVNTLPWKKFEKYMK